MDKALKISLYVAGGVATVLAANFVAKRLNSGIGFLTSKKYMGKYVAKSSEATDYPRDTKEEIKEWLEYWMDYGDDYTKAWYRAVWKSEHGDETPYFYVDNKRHKTKGGLAG